MIKHRGPVVLSGSLCLTTVSPLKSKRSSYLPVLLNLSIAATLIGCVTTGSTNSFLNSPDGAFSAVWPLPPEAPRIAYQGALVSDKSLGYQPSLWQRTRQVLLGIDTEQEVKVHRPFDVLADSKGRIITTNGLGGALHVFDVVSRKAESIYPTGNGTLTKPMGLSMDTQGLIYVADPAKRRVVAFDSDFQFVRAYGGPTELLNPVDVTVSPDDQFIYVIDSYLHQMVIYDRGGTVFRRIGAAKGDLAAKVASKQVPLASDPHAALRSSDLIENRGSTPAQFRYPAFIDAGPDGTIYVSDGMNFRVQAFDATGEYLFEFGRHGDTPGSFARPKGLAVNSEGHIYVADAAFNNIQIFDAEGRLLLSFGQLGNGPGDLWMPLGLAIDAEDRVYVADRFNSRIQIYQYLGESPPEPNVLPASSPKN